jgi:hypothetical protein
MKTTSMLFPTCSICSVMGTSTNHLFFYSRMLLSVAMAMLISSTAHAGFLVGNNAGAMGGNDTLAKVIEEITEYNAANDPDLTTNISLFKKSDDDATELFAPLSDFAFFEDAAGTIPIANESGLVALSEAYFSYSGPANILFYSVKGPSSFGFSLYTYMAGLNLLDLIGDSRDISHVSFWEGPPGIDVFGNPVPEPVSGLLLATAICFSVMKRRV